MGDGRRSARIELLLPVDVVYHVDGWEYIDSIREAGIDGFSATAKRLKDSPDPETAISFTCLGMQFFGQVSWREPRGDGCRYGVDTSESETWRTRIFPALMTGLTTSKMKTNESYHWWDRIIKFSPVIMFALVGWGISQEVNSRTQQLEIEQLKTEVSHIRELQTNQARTEEKLDGIEKQLKEVRRAVEGNRGR